MDKWKRGSWLFLWKLTKTAKKIEHLNETYATHWENEDEKTKWGRACALDEWLKNEMEKVCWFYACGTHVTCSVIVETEKNSSTPTAFSSISVQSESGEKILNEPKSYHRTRITLWFLRFSSRVAFFVPLSTPLCRHCSHYSSFLLCKYFYGSIKRNEKQNESIK